MPDSVDPTARAISDLRGDITLLRAEMATLMERLGMLTAGHAASEGEFAMILDLLKALKAGQPEAAKKPEFVGKRG